MAEPVIVFQKLVGNTHVVLVDTADGVRSIVTLSGDGSTTLLSQTADEAKAFAEALTDFNSIATQVPFSHFPDESAKAASPEVHPVTQEPAPTEVPSITSIADPAEEEWFDVPGGDFTVPSA